MTDGLIGWRKARKPATWDALASSWRIHLTPFCAIVSVT